MTAPLHPRSLSTRQSTEPGRAPFSSTPLPSRPHFSTLLPPGLSIPASSTAEPDLQTNRPLAIPELWSFDQEELNDNPVLNEACPIPLIGGLLIARKLITREQLDTCLQLQARTYPDLPIGQLLVQHGYLSQAALDQTLGIQAGMRSALDDTKRS